MIERLVKFLAFPVPTRSKELVVADFGCGEARLSQSVANTVHSFDLVAANERVQACDMADVPLADRSVDVAVFCLALMGTNINGDFFFLNALTSPPLVSSPSLTLILFSPPQTFCWRPIGC